MKNFDKLKSEYKFYEGKSEKLLSVLDELKSDSEIENFENIQSFRGDILGLIEKFKNPNVVISVVAEVSNGKSTFLNSLIFKKNVLHSGLGAVTATIFRIEYDNKYGISSSSYKQNFNSIDELQEAVREYNEDIRRKVDNQERVEIEEVVITLPDENLKQGITLYDTPGFGALDEEHIFPILKEAVTKSDAVIMLLDISQGLKKGEQEFVKTVLKAIPPKKRYVVLNKLDAIIDEDDLELMGKDEIERQLRKVTDDVLENLSKLSGINKSEIRHYKVSAKKALIGHIKDKKTALKESGFIEFENDFWNKVISEKSEVLEERVKSFDSLRGGIFGLLQEKEDELKKLIKELMSLKNALLEDRANLEAVLRRAIKDFQTHSMNLLHEQEIDTNYLFREIKDIIFNNVYEELLKNISFVDNITFWKRKSRYEGVVEVALKKSEEEIQEIIKFTLKHFLLKIYDIQSNLNESIKNINLELEKFKNLNISSLEYINIINKDNNNIKFSLFNSNSIDDEYWNSDDILDGIVIGGFYALLFGPIGFAIGAVLKAFSKDYDAVYKKIAKEISKDATDTLKKELKPKLDDAIYKLRALSIKVATAPKDIEYTLQTLLNSLESPEEKEKEIKKAMQQLSKTNQYKDEVKRI